MAEATGTTPQELAQQQRAQQEEQERSRVHPLDPDFLIFALPLALIFDAIDIILEATAILVVPKLLGMLFDVFVFALLGGWVYWRTGKIEKAKSGQERYKMQGQVSRKVQRVFLRVLRRVGLVFLAELIVFIGILPLWTIMVISTLREK